MEYKELCKDCLLHCKRIHNCPFCEIDFSKQKDILKLMCQRRNFKPAFANTTIQKNSRNVEVMRYNEEFCLLGNRSTSSRKRLWCYIENNVLAKVDKNNPNATLARFQLSKKKSRRRALNSFLNYGQNNDWGYFITMTFDPRKLDSTSQTDIKYAWQKFRQKLQYRFPNIQIMAVVEYHADDNKLHFHGVIGNADLNYALARAVNQQPFRKDRKGNIMLDKKGKPIPNEFYLNYLETNLGDEVYNFRPDVYNEGFCSVIPITDKTNDLSAFDKIVFYLAKYMSKDKSAVPYNGKSFFRTHNLKKAQKECVYMTDEDFEKFINKHNLEIKNKSEKFTSYVQRLDLAGIFDRAEKLWQPTYMNIDLEDIYKKARDIFDLEDSEVDPIFVE